MCQLFFLRFCPPISSIWPGVFAPIVGVRRAWGRGIAIPGRGGGERSCGRFWRRALSGRRSWRPNSMMGPLFWFLAKERTLAMRSSPLDRWVGDAGELCDWLWRGRFWGDLCASCARPGTGHLHRAYRGLGAICYSQLPDLSAYIPRSKRENAAQSLGLVGLYSLFCGGTLTHQYIDRLPHSPPQKPRGTQSHNRV